MNIKHDQCPLTKVVYFPQNMSMSFMLGSNIPPPYKMQIRRDTSHKGNTYLR